MGRESFVQNIIFNPLCMVVILLVYTTTFVSTEVMEPSLRELAANHRRSRGSISSKCHYYTPHFMVLLGVGGMVPGILFFKLHDESFSLIKLLQIKWGLQ